MDKPKLTVEEQLNNARIKVAPCLTKLFKTLKEVMDDGPNSLELFLTLGSFEITLKSLRNELWEKMHEGINDLSAKQKQEMKRIILEVAESMANSPSINAASETTKEKELWTPPKKNLVI